MWVPWNFTDYRYMPVSCLTNKWLALIGDSLDMRGFLDVTLPLLSDLLGKPLLLSFNPRNLSEPVPAEKFRSDYSSRTRLFYWPDTNIAISTSWFINFDWEPVSLIVNNTFNALRKSLVQIWPNSTVPHKHRQPDFLVFNYGLHYAHSSNLTGYRELLTSVLSAIDTHYTASTQTESGVMRRIFRLTASTHFPAPVYPANWRCRHPLRVRFLNHVVEDMIRPNGAFPNWSILDTYTPSLGRADSAPDNRHFTRYNVYHTWVNLLLNHVCPP